jgi:hypothetical protein
MIAQYQIPARGITHIYDLPHRQGFRASCVCLDPTHSVDFSVDIDNDTISRQVTVGVALTVEVPRRQSFWWRLRAAWRMLFNRPVRLEQEIVLDYPSAINLSETISRQVKRHDQ